MKQIEAIIRTSKFDEVKQALHEIDIDFFSYWDATGVGNEIHKAERIYRGAIIDTSNIPRRVLTIIVRDKNLRKTVDCILNTANTGEVGDGRIFVTNIEESWKIRNKTGGEDTLMGDHEIKEMNMIHSS
jgi:nitrogen regulatory protein P-II 1